MAATAGGVRLNAGLEAELARAAEAIDLDEETRVVVLGSQGRAFCCGESAGARVDDAVAAVAAIRQPVIALVGGDAVDAGFELALACDLRVAAPGARFGLTQIARGRLPVRGGTQRLPRLVGVARALRMLLLAEVVGARPALALGLVHEVIPARRLRAAGLSLARALAARGPIALRLAKEAIRGAQDLPLAEGMRLEGDLYVLLQSTRDRDEGVRSFREKRTPRYSGR